jgi:hypothetical protein
MDRSLWLLIGLRIKGWLRKAGRSLRSAKGILLTALGLLVFLPQFIALALDRSPKSLQLTDWPDRFVPWVLLIISLTTLIFTKADQAVVFTPAEMTLLFPAPYTRRRLMAYKLVSQLGLVAISAAVMSIFAVRLARFWPAAFLGALMALWFMNLFSILVMQAGLSIGAAAYILGLAVIALAIAAVLATGSIPQRFDLETWNQIENSPVTKVVLAPFQWITRTFTSRGFWPDLALWGSLALGVNAALFAAIILLDTQYLETSAVASEKLYTRLEKVRRGAPATALQSKGKKPRFSCPPLPTWNGSGPLIWRQATTAMRDYSRGLALIAVHGWALIVLVIVRFTKSGTHDDLTPVALAFAGAILGYGVFLPALFPFDFRGDIDRMDVLKSLPIRPSRLVLGQIVIPSLLLALTNWAVLALIGIACRPAFLPYLSLCLLALPLALLSVAVDNLVFLWLPFRFQSQSPGDFQMMGRAILLTLVKLVAYAIIIGPTALIAVGTYFLLGRSLTATFLVACVLLLAGAAALLPLLGHAFDRFDVARDVPA